MKRQYLFERIDEKSPKCYNDIKRGVLQMAFPKNIEDLIKCRVIESDRVEFKSDWDPTPIIHSICAFANDIDNVGGGYIVIELKRKMVLRSFR